MVESAPLLREYGGNLIEGSNPSLSAIYSIPGPVIFQARTDGTPSMKIIFSRKGFDSGSGGAPSPIIDGRPTSLPIPTLQMPSITTYADLGLGAIVEQVTRHIKAGKGRIAGASLCHHDPMFEGGRCAFGQSGAAQGHLSNNGIGAGDVFLFFGLFANLDDNDRHHRIFGYLKVEEVMKPGPDPTPASQPDSFTRRHPHTLPIKKPNNTIYVGPGRVATSAASRPAPVDSQEVPRRLEPLAGSALAPRSRIDLSQKTGQLERRRHHSSDRVSKPGIHLRHQRAPGRKRLARPHSVDNLCRAPESRIRWMTRKLPSSCSAGSSSRI